VVLGSVTEVFVVPVAAVSVVESVESAGWLVVDVEVLESDEPAAVTGWGECPEATE
jgi:hypothetical protein